MIGRKVYIRELDQLGVVREMSDRLVKKVEVQTPDGPKLVDVLEKGYKVISLVLAIWKLVLNFFGR